MGDSKSGGLDFVWGIKEGKKERKKERSLFVFVCLFVCFLTDSMLVCKLYGGKNNSLDV